jgi:hypothetical protein
MICTQLMEVRKLSVVLVVARAQDSARPQAADKRVKKPVLVAVCVLVSRAVSYLCRCGFQNSVFGSRIGMGTAEVRLSELSKVEGDTISLESLKAANVVRKDMKRARIMLSGEVTRAFKVEDVNVAVTKGARAAIETAGGQVMDIEAPVRGRLVKKEKATETA